MRKCTQPRLGSGVCWQYADRPRELKDNAMTKTTRIAALATFIGLGAVAAGAGIVPTPTPTFERTHATPAMQAAHPELF